MDDKSDQQRKDDSMVQDKQSASEAVNVAEQNGSPSYRRRSDGTLHVGHREIKSGNMETIPDVAADGSLGHSLPESKLRWFEKPITETKQTRRHSSAAECELPKAPLHVRSKMSDIELL